MAFARSRSLLALVVLLFGCGMEADGEEEEEARATSAWTSPDDPSWDCYAAEPGHPTAAEKARFFSVGATYAKEAERTYGVPAAALLAMSAVEGGYGFTRIAQYAHNTFGYKFTTSSAAGGRGSYTLACQPAWDENKRYVSFYDRRDGYLFVARKLATRADWANYKAATDRYRADRAAGVDVRVAVDRWVDGIADEGYNYAPATYKRTIKSVMASANLYAHSR